MDIPIQKKAVIYCRVSTKEQVEEGNSLATQERNCREYALKHGFEIVAIFIEQGESAKTADRTELKKLFVYCSSKKNAVSAVIAYKIDRISRNTDDYSQIRIMLRKYGVEIRSTSEHFEDTPAGRFMENIIANVAQFDNDVRAERCAGGMRDAVREGRYVWMAPYGYSNVRVNGRATIAPNENAIFVRKAFEEVALQRYPIDIIQNKLFAEGMMNTSGKKFSKSHFYDILKKELYTGWITKFKEKHQGTFEPLIPEGLFQLVQEIISGKRQVTRNNRRPLEDFPLRRFFWHPSGRVLTGCWSQGRRKKYPYYLIHGHNINIRKEIIESAFKDFLNSFKMDIDLFQSLLQRAKEYTVHGISEGRLKNEDLQGRIALLKTKQEQLLDKNLAGVISNEMAKEHISKIDSEIYQLREQSKIIPSASINYTQLLEATKSVLLRPGDAWANAGIHEKIKLQWFYFPNGIEFDGKQSRTHKMCKLFNPNEEFHSYLSPNVDYRFEKLNTPIKQIPLPKNRRAIRQQFPIEEIQEELLQLDLILHPPEQKEYLMQRA